MAALRKVVAQVPPDLRAALPAAEGEPQVEIVGALFRHERTKPDEVLWTEVRELSAENWDAVIAVQGEIQEATVGTTKALEIWFPANRGNV